MNADKPVIEETESKLEPLPEVKDNAEKKKVVSKTAKKWKCAECEFVYISPIPVSAVEHKCHATPVPGKRAKGMLPAEQ
jgi:hypothetical protein